MPISPTFKRQSRKAAITIENYCVYKHTCPNGKVYIGVTGRKPEYRFSNGRGYKANQYFYNAIKKYGWENINHEIIESGLSKYEAMEKEKEYISLHKSFDRAYGYNLTYGGEIGSKFTNQTKRKISDGLRKYYSVEENRQRISESHVGKKHSEETKRKMSIAHKNISEETREKMRKANTGRKYPNRVRKPTSEETKRKISESKRGKHFGGKGKKPKRVICVETGLIFVSVIEAGKNLGKDYSSIYKCCRGKRKTAHGYTWQYVI